MAEVGWWKEMSIRDFVGWEREDGTILTRSEAMVLLLTGSCITVDGQCMRIRCSTFLSDWSYFENLNVLNSSCDIAIWML